MSSKIDNTVPIKSQMTALRKYDSNCNKFELVMAGKHGDAEPKAQCVEILSQPQIFSPTDDKKM